MMKSDWNLLKKRAALISVAAQTLADSLKSGGFASLYRGQGVEFSGVREYLPSADDARSIDWNVTARMNRPFVKEYAEERELQIFMLLDISRSMEAGCSGRTRLEAALECAELLALAAEKNSSPVGAAFFDLKTRLCLAPKGGMAQTMILLSKCGSAVSLREEGEGGSSLGGALAAAAKILKNRALVLIFSDFRTEAAGNSGWEKPLGILAARHEVIAVRICDKGDSALPDAGGILAFDSESGGMQVLPTHSAKFQREWRRFCDEGRRLWQEKCLRRGAYPLVLGTNDDCAAVLAQFFSGRRRSV